MGGGKGETEGGKEGGGGGGETTCRQGKCAVRIGRRVGYRLHLCQPGLIIFFQLPTGSCCPLPCHSFANKFSAELGEPQARETKRVGGGGSHRYSDTGSWSKEHAMWGKVWRSKYLSQIQDCCLTPPLTPHGARYFFPLMTEMLFPLSRPPPLVLNICWN